MKRFYETYSPENHWHTKVTLDGRIVIPREILKLLHIPIGSQLKVFHFGNDLMIIPESSNVSFCRFSKDDPRLEKNGVFILPERVRKKANYHPNDVLIFIIKMTRNDDPHIIATPVYHRCANCGKGVAMSHEERKQRALKKSEPVYCYRCQQKIAYEEAKLLPRQECDICQCEDDVADYGEYRLCRDCYTVLYPLLEKIKHTCEETKNEDR